ncbi:potassium channel family protein [Elioraea sp.]|uniref:potassium channel family protein n=1 Tax=Elioraea sp. TaxID=2185103 RepID=UPI0025C41892|nr:potassium channel family protein [Elioraea sp.]
MRAQRMDRAWWRAVMFTAGLLLLVGLAARDHDRGFIALLIAVAVAGSGFFYLLFPGSLHFALALANFLAVYATLFVFFSETNFPNVSRLVSYTGFVLPVAAFLSAAWRQRVLIGGLVSSERMRGAAHFGRLARWLVPVALVGVASFSLPEFGVSRASEEAAFLVAMAAIAVVVAFAERDVVAFLIDISLIFEAFFVRIRHLIIPALAFLTFYSLLVIVFACLYRIVDGAVAEPMFAFAGIRRAMSFPDALYFSVVTLSTIGYGDVVPVGPAARMLASIQSVMGLLLLLFGFNEILRVGREHDGDRLR